MLLSSHQLHFLHLDLFCMSTQLSCLTDPPVSVLALERPRGGWSFFSQNAAVWIRGSAGLQLLAAVSRSPSRSREHREPSLWPSASVSHSASYYSVRLSFLPLFIHLSTPLSLSQELRLKMRSKQITAVLLQPDCCSGDAPKPHRSDWQSIMGDRGREEVTDGGRESEERGEECGRERRTDIAAALLLVSSRAGEEWGHPEDVTDPISWEERSCRSVHTHPTHAAWRGNTQQAQLGLDPVSWVYMCTTHSDLQSASNRNLSVPHRLP